MRVVLDTNVIVSRFLSTKGAPARILDRWEARAFKLVLSEPILAEYHRILGYKSLRIRHHLSAERIETAIAKIRRSGTIVDPTERVRAVRDDPKDDIFLECAVAGEADYIVSGDAHLLSLREYDGIQILSPAMFLDVLKREGR